MAKRVAPSRHQADNSAGNFTSAACNDWPDVRRFHVGTDHSESTPDAGYTTACASSAILSINFLAFRGSPYTGLAARPVGASARSITHEEAVRHRNLEQRQHDGEGQSPDDAGRHRPPIEQGGLAQGPNADLDRGTDYASATEQRKKPVGSKANRGMSGYSKGSDDRRGYRSARWGSSGIPKSDSAPSRSRRA